MVSYGNSESISSKHVRSQGWIQWLLAKRLYLKMKHLIEILICTMKSNFMIQIKTLTVRINYIHAFGLLSGQSKKSTFSHHISACFR